MFIVGLKKKSCGMKVIKKFSFWRLLVKKGKCIWILKGIDVVIL